MLPLCSRAQLAGRENLKPASPETQTSDTGRLFILGFTLRTGSERTSLFALNVTAVKDAADVNSPHLDLCRCLELILALKH